MLDGLAALRRWGVWRYPVRGILVSRPGSHRRRVDALTVIRGSVAIAPGDSRMLRGMPTACIARAVLVAAEDVGVHWIVNILHEAAFRHRYTLDEVSSMVKRYPRTRAACVVRQARDLHLAGSAGFRSRAEGRFRGALDEIGCPEAEVSSRIETALGSIEIDLVWRDRRICVEVDGPQHAWRPRDVIRDRNIGRHLADAGWTLLRVPHDATRADARRVTAAVRSHAVRPHSDGRLP